MGCLKLSYYDNKRVGLTVVRAGAGVNEKIARPDVTAVASFFRSGQQHTTVLNFLLLFGSSQKVGIVDEGRILHDQQTSSKGTTEKYQEMIQKYEDDQKK